MTGTSAQPSPRNKEGWWVSLQPLLLSHTLINNHTESLPWPGGEKREKRAHLGSSSPLPADLFPRVNQSNHNYTLQPFAPLFPLNDTNLNHPNSAAVERSHLAGLGHCKGVFKT